MADPEASALRAIHATLRYRGYRRLSGQTNHAWEGTELVEGRDIGLVVHVEDLYFARLPVIALKEPGTTIRAHVLRGGAICYAADASLVLDPSNPGGSILRCIEQVRQTLARSGSEANAEIRAEFATYWNGDSVLTDLEEGGEAYLYGVPRNDSIMLELVATSSDLPEFLASRYGTSAQQITRVRVLHLDVDLDIRGEAFPPETLEEACDWLRAVAPDKVDIFLRSLLDHDAPRTTFLAGRNATVGVAVDLPPDIKRMRGPGFRDDAWRNEARRRASEVAIRRYTCRRCDRAYRLERNLYMQKPLAGRRIALIGCGAIGGYLAQGIARSGAGTGPQGALDLYDPDKLLPDNLGRHLLGIEDLLQAKADRVAARLRSEAPRLTIDSYVTDALGRISQMSGYDLIVEATGEERVALALNERAQQERRAGRIFPPILHCWLTGNGAAAQTFLNRVDDKACLRCLRPDLAQRGRYWPLKPKVDQELRVPADGCGGSYVPYAVSAPMIAAGLAVEAILDWAKGDPRPTLRTLNIDQSRTEHHKNVSPSRHPACPACGDGGPLTL
ncbi:ThiF family adenylyltransferase [Thalassobaculum sp.]|uniref:ThiF family adenylyltransferase n=1 Tax=Thalassobaculum sp. TaxID=2022740 RepID=UPI003B58CE0D